MTETIHAVSSVDAEPAAVRSKHQSLRPAPVEHIATDATPRMSLRRPSQPNHDLHTHAHSGHKRNHHQASTSQRASVQPASATASPSDGAIFRHPVRYANHSIRQQALYHLVHQDLSPSVGHLRQFYTHFLSPILGDPKKHGVDHEDDLYLVGMRLKHLIIQLVSLYRRLADGLLVDTESQSSEGSAESLQGAGELALVRVLCHEMEGEGWRCMEMYLRRFARMSRLISWIVQDAEDAGSQPQSPSERRTRRPWAGWRRRWRDVSAMGFCQGIGLWAMYFYPLRAWLQIESALTLIWNSMPKRHPDHQLAEAMLARLNHLLQPLHTEAVWQKRLRLLAIQEAIFRQLVAEGRLTPTATTAVTVCMGTGPSESGVGGNPLPHMVSNDQLSLSSMILLTPGRHLIEEGHMYKVHRHTGGASAFVKVLLFNDLLVYGYDHLHDHDGNVSAQARRRRVSVASMESRRRQGPPGSPDWLLPTSEPTLDRYSVRRLIALQDGWVVISPEEDGSESRAGPPAPLHSRPALDTVKFQMMVATLDPDHEDIDASPNPQHLQPKSNEDERESEDEDQPSTFKLERIVFLCRSEKERIEWQDQVRDAIEQLAAVEPVFCRRQTILQLAQRRQEQRRRQQQHVFEATSWLVRWTRRLALGATGVSSRTTVDWAGVRPDEGTLHLQTAVDTAPD